MEKIILASWKSWNCHGINFLIMEFHETHLGAYYIFEYYF